MQFELPFENEEFLREGLALIDLNFSQLDLCQHRAIALLTKNCNQLTSEEIGKLAVMLLNCQFEGEGRGTFPCTTEMVNLFKYKTSRTFFKVYKFLVIKTMHHWNGQQCLSGL